MIVYRHYRTGSVAFDTFARRATDIINRERATDVHVYASSRCNVLA